MAEVVTVGLAVGTSVGALVGVINAVGIGLRVTVGAGVKNCFPRTKATAARTAITAKTKATIKTGEAFFGVSTGTGACGGMTEGATGGSVGDTTGGVGEGTVACDWGFTGSIIHNNIFL